MKHATSWLLVATKVSQVYGAIAKQTLVRKKKMSESMAAATSTVALPESNVPPSPLLSLSQEEFLMRDVSVSTSTTQVSKTYNFSNCNVIFNN